MKIMLNINDTTWLYNNAGAKRVNGHHSIDNLSRLVTISKEANENGMVFTKQKILDLKPGKVIAINTGKNRVDYGKIEEIKIAVKAHELNSYTPSDVLVNVAWLYPAEHFVEGGTETLYYESNHTQDVSVLTINYVADDINISGTIKV